jgi:hypothetical protein
MKRSGIVLLISSLITYGLAHVILPAEGVKSSTAAQTILDYQAAAVALFLLFIGVLSLMLGSEQELLRLLAFLVVTLTTIVIVLRGLGWVVTHRPFLEVGGIIALVLAGVTIVFSSRILRRSVIPLSWTHWRTKWHLVNPRRLGLALILLSGMWVTVIRLHFNLLSLRGHEFAMVWVPLGGFMIGLVGIFVGARKHDRRAALEPLGRGWRLVYTGDWPEYPPGPVTVYIGYEIQVEASGSRKAVNLDQVRDVFLRSAGGESIAGWKYRDNNTGREYTVAFRFPRHPQADRFYKTVLRTIHRSQTVWWDEWRQLVIRLQLSELERRHGGVRALTLHRQVACPQCAADAVGLPQCPFCHGKRFTVEEDSVTVAVPPGVEPGHTIQIPFRGNRDANGVSGPLFITISTG